MQNGVFYGEYTLKYWLDMMLDRRIVLPEYQRYFVWNASQVKGLIETFRDGRFVPPVTIGSYGCQGERQNLIIDGQQRLTSILLARLGKVPNRTWRSTDGGLAGGNEEGVTGLSDDDEDSIDVKRWKYAQLLGDSDNTIEGLSRRCENGRYIDITPVDDTFLETHFLGFCYVVPAKDSKEEQQAYYAKMFRSVNVGGIPLSQMESRRSLYFLKQDYENIFDPGFAKHITLKGQSKTVSPAQLDFVRYISLLAEYNNAQAADKIARGYKMRIESYYEEFICAIINHEESEKFGLSCNVFRVKKIKDILLKVEHVIKTNHFEREYASIIDREGRLDDYLNNYVDGDCREGDSVLYVAQGLSKLADEDLFDPQTEMQHWDFHWNDYQLYWKIAAIVANKLYEMQRRFGREAILACLHKSLLVSGALITGEYDARSGGSNILPVLGENFQLVKDRFLTDIAEAKRTGRLEKCDKRLMLERFWFEIVEHEKEEEPKLREEFIKLHGCDAGKFPQAAVLIMLFKQFRSYKDEEWITTLNYDLLLQYVRHPRTLLRTLNTNKAKLTRELNALTICLDFCISQKGKRQIYDIDSQKQHLRSVWGKR